MSIGGRLNVIALSIAVVSVLLIGGIGLGAMRYMIRIQEDDLAERARIHLDNAVSTQAIANQTLATTLARLPIIQEHFIAGDRPGLLAELGEAYSHLRDFGITNLHLHRANTTTLVRLHAPSQYDDDLSAIRPMIREVNDDLKPRRGIEVGVNGIPIRGATPVITADGRHLGALEVGSFLNDAFLQDFEKPGTSYSVYFIKDGQPLPIAKSAKTTAAAFSDSQIMQLANGQPPPVRRSQTGENHFVSTMAPLTSFDGRTIGAVQIDIDTTALEKTFDREIQFLLLGTLAVLLLTGLAVTAGTRPILRRIDRLIATTTAIAEGTAIMVPMQDRRDEFGRFARAIEKFRVSQAELSEARDQAQAASIAKSNFLAVMSHELRTPLNAIIGFTELMQLRRAQNRSFGDRETEYINDIHSSAMHLMALVEDVLTNSAIDTGGLSVKLGPTNLTVEVANILRLLEPKARHMEQKIEVDLAEGLPPVMSDPRALHQICLNLISNAIKFTPRGGRIGVRVAIEDADFCVEVTDTGPGIAAQHLMHVTEAFYQAASAQARSAGGVGLGLTIAHRLARMLGGDLKIVNRPEAGLSVSLYCPARSAEARALLEQSTQSVA